MGEFDNKLVNPQGEGMGNNDLPEAEQGSETVISKVFQRLVSDKEFKELLLVDPDAALSEYQLSDTQAVLIKTLSESDLDKLTPENLEEFFAADAAVYTPDEADLLDFEEYSPEDFEEME